jgi:hypothetical protein
MPGSILRERFLKHRCDKVIGGTFLTDVASGFDIIKQIIEHSSGFRNGTRPSEYAGIKSSHCLTHASGYHFSHHSDLCLPPALPLSVYILMLLSMHVQLLFFSAQPTLSVML